MPATFIAAGLPGRAGTPGLAALLLGLAAFPAGTRAQGLDGGAPIAVPPAPPPPAPLDPPAPPGPSAPACPIVPLDARKLSIGERLKLHLDVFGADMGDLELWTEPPAPEERGSERGDGRGPPGPIALVAHARAKTSAFVTTNVGEYSTFATSKLGPSLLPLSAREEVDESATHWQIDLAFPVAGPQLNLKLSKNGEPLASPTPASPSARDLLSAFYAMRASLDGLGKPGAPPLCFEIYGARKMWKMTGALGARESIDTAAGKQKTLRIDLTSTRLDDPRVVRTSKLWFGDDARHLLWAAVAEVRGKVIRAQLVSASGRGWAVGAP